MHYSFFQKYSVIVALLCTYALTSNTSPLAQSFFNTFLHKVSQLLTQAEETAIASENSPLIKEIEKLSLVYQKIKFFFSSEQTEILDDIFYKLMKLTVHADTLST